MSNANIEYTLFQGIRFHNVTLPLFQAAYIIGMPEYLLSTDETVYLVGNGNKINASEYITMLDDLCAWYESEGEYFPLSNIILAREGSEAAFELIKRGIIRSIKTADYRMIKQFCRLLTYGPQFTNEQIHMIIELFEEMVSVGVDDRYKLNKYLASIGEIRDMLLRGNFGMPILEVTVKTDIPADDSETIGQFVEQLNSKLMEIVGDSRSHYIELRHNSPHEFMISLSNLWDNIQPILVDLWVALGIAYPVMDKGLGLLQKYFSVTKVFEDKKSKKKESTDNPMSSVEHDELVKLRVQNEMLREQISKYECMIFTRDDVLSRHVIDVNFVVV
jgi:hypothetical protein